MLPATPDNVERYLFERGGWVSAVDLMHHWDLSERGLRRMLAGVAVAGERGYIHTYHATTEEVEAYCGPKHKHAITEFKTVRQARLNHQRRRQPNPAPETLSAVAHGATQ
jgi:hypothetical protein